MPVYELYCPACDMKFDVITIYSERDKIRCHKCRGKVEALLTAANFSIRGDNAKNSYGLKRSKQDDKK